MRFELANLRHLPIAALVAAGLFASPPAASAATDEVTQQLKETRRLIGKLNIDADRLVSFTHGSRLGWQTHAFQLNQIRDHINAIGEDLAWLQVMRPVSAPWQQAAIDRVVPVAADLADRTTAAIGHLNENQSLLFAPEYVDHLQTIAGLADHMDGTLGDYLKMAQTRDNLQALEERLEGVS
ncbi:MAG TPA: hypothetical protein VGL97_10300 [Bryobacteraceae bacterium]